MKLYFTENTYVAVRLIQLNLCTVCLCKIFKNYCIVRPFSCGGPYCLQYKSLCRCLCCKQLRPCIQEGLATGDYHDIISKFMLQSCIAIFLNVILLKQPLQYTCTYERIECYKAMFAQTQLKQLWQDYLNFIRGYRLQA